jgi:hypothetical protein
MSYYSYLKEGVKMGKLSIVRPYRKSTGGNKLFSAIGLGKLFEYQFTDEEGKKYTIENDSSIVIDLPEKESKLRFKLGGIMKIISVPQITEGTITLIEKRSLWKDFGRSVQDIKFKTDIKIKVKKG